MTNPLSGLPHVSRPILFTCAMLLLLHAALALGAGVMSAFGHPDLLAAMERAYGLGKPLLEAAVALLPVALIVDGLGAAPPAQP